MTAAIVAHRGFSARHLENTVAAIRAALRVGVDFVEVDVHETRDGKLVVFHDRRLNRICRVPGRVRDMTLREMKALNPQIPSLRQVLRMCRGRAGVVVEIKRADPRKVAAEIDRCGMTDEVIVLARSLRYLAEVAAVSPGIRRFALVTAGPPCAFPVEVHGLAVPQRMIRTAADVRRLRRCGLELFVWTVNRRARMKRLIAWGVDGLITDWPDRAKSVLARV
ncbi:MAG: glycerophosphodiester phosphodiesterase [Verrucomicrobiae bacterium]|nr:glycerophosphodiester phosphodiesterase [Verrucomicrobiae bacterium]